MVVVVATLCLSADISLKSWNFCLPYTNDKLRSLDDSSRLISYAMVPIYACLPLRA